MRDEDIEEVVLRKRRLREEGKAAFDNSHRLRKTPIREEDIVLVYHSKRAIDMSAKVKLGFKWLGSYKVSEANNEKGTYKLEELDGAPFKGTFAGNRLKKFIRMEGQFFLVEPDSDDDNEGSDATNLTDS